MEDQQKAWNNIAKEWYEFKDKHKKIDNLQHDVHDFVKKCKGNVIDLGSGTGRFLHKIPKGKMWLVDFSEQMLKLAQKKAKSKKIPTEIILAQAYKLPFKNNFFDSGIAIFSIHCIEKKQNRNKAIKELYRVLKPGAKAKISVWNKDTKRFKNSPKERIVRWRNIAKRYYYLYEPEEIYTDFKKVGFNIFQKDYPGKSITFIVKKPKS
ncbi:MAG: class I SAM-dependent methyltransferase [archaeon]